jgi:hypothetical protein
MPRSVNWAIWVWANNGEVVEIRALTDNGMLVRNDAGIEGLVAWRKIQARPDAPCG